MPLTPWRHPFPSPQWKKQSDCNISAWFLCSPHCYQSPLHWASGKRSLYLSWHGMILATCPIEEERTEQPQMSPHMLPSLHRCSTIHRGVLLVLSCSIAPRATFHRNDYLYQNPWEVLFPQWVKAHLNNRTVLSDARWGRKVGPNASSLLTKRITPKWDKYHLKTACSWRFPEVLLEAQSRMLCVDHSLTKVKACSYLCCVLSAVGLKEAPLGLKALGTVITWLVKPVLQVLKKPENRTKAKKYKSVVLGGQRHIQDPCRISLHQGLEWDYKYYRVF